MIELPAKVSPNSFVFGFEGFHLQKSLVLRGLDQNESPSCPDVDALTHATFSFVEDLGKPYGLASSTLVNSDATACQRLSASQKGPSTDNDRSYPFQNCETSLCGRRSPRPC